MAVRKQRSSSRKFRIRYFFGSIIRYLNTLFEITNFLFVEQSKVHLKNLDVNIDVIQNNT